jgi:hypothetical protein
MQSQTGLAIKSRAVTGSGENLAVCVSLVRRFSAGGIRV